MSVKESDEKEKNDNKNWYPVKKKKREDLVEANSNKESALDPPA